MGANMRNDKMRGDMREIEKAEGDNGDDEQRARKRS